MFKDIIGQNSAIKILQAAVRNNRWASSYLFVGPDGIGKKLTALSFAKLLNCYTLGEKEDIKSKEIYSLHACNRCISCKKIIKGGHPDVQIISPQETSISINQIRSLQKDAVLKSFEGSNKIYIIDDAHTMTHEAMNCFLKILEEPPKDVIFILITSNQLMLLGTIISRCQVIKFKTLDKKDISEILINKHNISQEVALFLASISDGSVGVALNYRDYELVSTRQNMLKLLEGVSSGNLDFLFQEAEKLSNSKDDIQIQLNLFLSLYRDIWIKRIILKVSYDETKSALFSNVDILNDIIDKLDKGSQSSIRDRIEAVLDTKTLIKNNVNLRLALETMFLRLMDTDTGK